MKKIALLVMAMSSTIAFAANKDAALDAKALTVIQRDFRDKGIAKVDRVKQDQVQALCTQYRDHPPHALQDKLEKEQLAAVKYPADGKLMGDWKAGEKLAQSGRGLTWTDKEGDVVGGNCYNCHQLSPKEIAYGTIGPSLLHFGKMRGNTPDMQKYVYGRIYNAKAFNLCTNMPRFGHVGALTESQIKDLVALLLDPESLVNKE
ncbi:MAG: sulfur oxidation c-type cytochrome SoxX [Gallionella sp.]|nr:sulfur oxidation c-type cytochrome SoxX [Gallionella sp.]MDD4959758.1 sulfur oxidation c-type cytochrome SoxX [Gallionella sp.]